MDLEIVNLEDRYLAPWDAFCEASNEAWFWHTTKWLRYSLSYGRDRLGSQDLSFFIRDAKGILAICPLLLEKNLLSDGRCVLEFQAGGGGVIAPAFHHDLGDDHREKIRKRIFDHINVLAARFGVARGSFYVSPLAGDSAQFNGLMKLGFFNNSLHSQMLDLTPEIDVLWKDIRKGHKSDIKRGTAVFQVDVYDQGTITKEVFEQYRFLHHKAAGRVTRPLETFEMQYEWIREGCGLLAAVSKDGMFTGFSYLLLYKDGAYYMSASEDPDHGIKVPVYHATQWAAIKWLKANGFVKYELGVQQFGPQLYDIPTDKDINISLFKRGFGGKTVPLFRVEKYYDVDYMDFLMNRRLALLKTGMVSLRNI